MQESFDSLMDEKAFLIIIFFFSNIGDGGIVRNLDSSVKQGQSTP